MVVKDKPGLIASAYFLLLQKDIMKIIRKILDRKPNPNAGCQVYHYPTGLPTVIQTYEVTEQDGVEISRELKSSKTTQNIQFLYTLNPEGKWIYELEQTLECPTCRKKSKIADFDHATYEEDGNYYHYTACPECYQGVTIVNQTDEEFEQNEV